MVRMTRPRPRVGYPGSCGRNTRCGITTSGIQRHRDPDGPSRSPPAVAALLKKRIEDRPADDFVFTSRTGLPLHNGDFYTHVWRKLMTAVAAEHIAPFRFHDLRHTHVAWLIAGGAPLPHIQARLGHESITTTIDTYGHLLPVGDELISDIIDTALRGGEIRPAMRLISGGGAATKS